MNEINMTRAQTIRLFVLSVGSFISTCSFFILLSDKLCPVTKIKVFQADSNQLLPRLLVVMISIIVGFIVDSQSTRILKIIDGVVTVPSFTEYLVLPFLNLATDRIDNCGDTGLFCIWCLPFALFICKFNLVWKKDDSGFMYAAFVCFSKLVMTNGYFGNTVETGCAFAVMFFSGISKYSEERIPEVEVTHED